MKKFNPFDNTISVKIAVPSNARRVSQFPIIQTFIKSTPNPSHTPKAVSENVKYILDSIPVEVTLPVIETPVPVPTTTVLPSE